MCFGDCLLAATDQYVKDGKDHIWLTFPSIEQLGEHWSQFITRELVGRPAQFAGDAELKKKKRVFGVIRFDESFAGLDQAGAQFVKDLRGKGVPLAADVPYELDLAQAQENARNMIAKLKDGEGHDRDLRGRPGHAVVGHEGSHRAELLPRVGRARRRVHRHVAVRPPVRPDSSGSTRSACRRCRRR